MLRIHQFYIGLKQVGMERTNANNLVPFQPFQQRSKEFKIHPDGPPYGGHITGARASGGIRPVRDALIPSKLVGGSLN